MAGIRVAVPLKSLSLSRLVSVAAGHKVGNTTVLSTPSATLPGASMAPDTPGQAPQEGEQRLFPTSNTPPTDNASPGQSPSPVSQRFAQSVRFFPSHSGLLSRPLKPGAAISRLQPGAEPENQSGRSLADVIAQQADNARFTVQAALHLVQERVKKGKVDDTLMLGALLLIHADIPPALVTRRYLGVSPHTPEADQQIAAIAFQAGHPSIDALWRSLAPMPADDRGFALNATSAGTAETMRTVNVVTEALDAVDFVREVMANLPAAKAHGTTLGFEFEFNPNGATRDAAYDAVVMAFRAAGFQVTLEKKDSDFTFIVNQDKILPIVWGNGELNGRPFNIEILTGTGAKVVTVALGMDKAKTEVAPPSMASLYDTSPLLARLLSDKLKLGHLHLGDVLPFLRDVAHYVERFFVLLKDDGFDILHVDIALLGNGKARLTGANGKIYDQQGIPQDTMEIDYSAELADLTPEERDNRPDLRAIHNWCKKNIPNKVFAKKTDTAVGMTVDGLGKGAFKIVAEASPYLEAVTPVLTIDEVPAAATMIQAFKDSGFSGTHAAYLIGMHVHAGLLHKVNGQFSIAPSLSLMRAFVEHMASFYRIIPSDWNRAGFIQLPPRRLVDLLAEPNYITDPNDPGQILRFIADYALHHPPKYGTMNLDNGNSHMINAMGKAGVLREGDEFDAVYQTAQGETNTYRIVIRKTSGLYKAYRTFFPGEVKEVTQTGEIVRATHKETLPITRISTDPIETTELRMPDSINDPKAVTFIAQFWASFVDKFGNGPFLPQ